MLLEFRVANFRSFAEEQVFSFVADKDQTLIENTVECPQSPTGRVIRLAVLYGPNGGGKSTLVRAVNAFRSLVVDSARWQEGDRITAMEPFKLDDELRRAPCRFEASFVADWSDPDNPETVRPIRYQYGFVADSERIHEEWLIAYPHGQPQTWFDRSPDRIDFGRQLRGEKKRLADATRSNALFISVAAQQNQPQLLPVFRLIRKRLKTVGVASGGLIGESASRRRPIASKHTSARWEHGTLEVREFLLDYLRVADVGITDVRVERRQLDPTTLPPTLPPELRDFVLDKQGEFVDVRVAHRGRDEQSVEWSLAEESEGTQNLYCLLGPWLDCLILQESAFFDELFSDLHSLLAQKLLERFFVEAEALESSGQVLLTTHDTNLLDSKLLRRDQIWFVEKNPDGASRLYSLLEYRPRKDENFEKGYLAGRYGALPFVGELKF